MPKAESLAEGPALVLFRDDLRLDDNRALIAAAETGRPLVALYVLDGGEESARALGGAALWWLDGSLRALARSIEARGGRLLMRRGPMAQTVLDVVSELGVVSVDWNRRYHAAGVASDTRMKAALAEAGVAARSHAGALLYEPWEVKTAEGAPYRVFTPFWRACRGLRAPDLPEPAPHAIRWADVGAPYDTLDQWGLRPTRPDWAGGLRDAWTPGEQGAQARLDAFLKSSISLYKDERDRPDRDSTSRLSPYLRFGDISPRRVYASAIAAGRAAGAEAATEKFVAELGWREFSYSLLYHQPDLASENLQAKFNRFPWRTDPEGLAAWRAGRTGYPLVDAGMRQLWATGWMHNRVRMVTASFLIKHLMIDWREGEAWFWDTLVDADWASNAASWQWVAGSGADAAPYFRIFNPITQGGRNDPAGAYVRQWVPELARLSNGDIHDPSRATASALRAAGVSLGETYPCPLVDHGEARTRALAAFESLKAVA